ncbi:MAG: 2Fe-2S iron-sulfur cluster binding domain-containing protein [Pseudomonadales bacterium]|nr:2Fe-2S iron-sulfur cluster binding domain-containing protein [Pseudomonadales bacterium]
MIEFTLNGEVVRTDDTPDTPLLWAVRDTFKLKGSKYGCGAGLCGACTMHLDGQAVRTCVLPISAVAGKAITTIEGLGTPEDLHPLQAAWAEQSVPQCGYCQSGQIMSAAAFLAENPNPSEAELENAMAGNICRCGCYPRIKKAILSVAETSSKAAELATEVSA